MNTRPQRLSLSLPKKAIFTLPDAHEVDIECTSGAVWITIDPPRLHEWRHPPADPDGWDGFVLARDGEALAEVDPLGGFVRWRASDDGSVDAAS